MLVRPGIDRIHGTHSSQRSAAPMEHATFFCRNGQLPFGVGLRIPTELVGNDDPVHAEPRQFAVRSAFVFQERVAQLGTNLAVDREIEFPRHTGRPDRAVAVEQMNAAPH